MSRLIDADALLEDLKQSHDWLLKIYESLPFEVEKRVCSAEIATFNEIGLRIKAAPTIEAEPVQHGEWLRENIRPKSYLRVCSMCKKTAYFCGEGCSYKFCPHCGVKMDGGTNNASDRL